MLIYSGPVWRETCAWPSASFGTDRSVKVTDKAALKVPFPLPAFRRKRVWERGRERDDGEGPAEASGVTVKRRMEDRASEWRVPTVLCRRERQRS